MYFAPPPRKSWLNADLSLSLTGLKTAEHEVSKQFLNGTSAHYRLLSAIKLEVTKTSES